MKIDLVMTHIVDFHSKSLKRRANEMKWCFARNNIDEENVKTRRIK